MLLRVLGERFSATSASEYAVVRSKIAEQIAKKELAVPVMPALELIEHTDSSRVFDCKYVDRVFYVNPTSVRND